MQDVTKGLNALHTYKQVVLVMAVKYLKRGISSVMLQGKVQYYENTMLYCTLD